MKATRRTSRRGGLTLLELLLAIAITSIIGLGISSMLTMVAQGTQVDQDRRSAVVRVHALNVRLRAYLADALNILQHDPQQGIVVWIHDLGSDHFIHLTEIRILWWDDLAGTFDVERIEFPLAWSDFQRQSADIALLAGTDFFGTMVAYRTAGQTVRETLLDNIQTLSFALNNVDTQQATRVEVALVERAGQDVQLDALQTFGLPNHTVPRR